jgi:hypothetical protein
VASVNGFDFGGTSRATINDAESDGVGSRADADLPGRGQSERLLDSSDYVLPQYCSDMTPLIGRQRRDRIDGGLRLRRDHRQVR